MAAAILDQLDRYGPDHCPVLDYDAAAAYTRDLAESHYENFTVVSWMLPRHLREHFRHVYAFCRWADDLGDEVGDPAQSLELLAWWRSELDRCYAGEPRHPVFVALRPTIERFDVPRQPFDDLITAFEQDQTVRRYETWEQVLDYCSRSASPVGRLVLYLCGHRDAERQALSDATCTALQLANFWQDVRRDILERNRIYIPAQIARAHGLDLGFLAKVVELDRQPHERPGVAACDDGPACNCAGDGHSSGIKALLPSYRRTILDLCRRTGPLFERGRDLWPRVDRRVRPDIKLFTLGGEAVLRMIERRGGDTLTARPTLGGPAKAALIARALGGKLLTLGRVG